jgi:hypothetical protein
MPEVLEQQLAKLSGFEEASSGIWQARELLFQEAKKIVVKASVLPTEITATAQRIAELGGHSVAQSTGLITAALPPGADIASLRFRLEAEGGSLVILHQPTPQYDPWGAPPDSLLLQQTIKQRFDPNRILNPGIFFDGI